MFRLIKLLIKNRVTSFVLLTLLCPGAAFSISDNDEIQVQSNYMKLNLETGSSIYTGNVNITQGSITLTGENVVITRKDDEIQDINVDGKPAHYLQDENTDNKVHAISEHMKYVTRTHRLVMTGNASLEQSDQTVESQRIVYDTQNKVIIAGKDKNTKTNEDRVNIILTPKKETQAPANKENK
jgi:lipopolysaccharide export system protein LptA